MYFLYFHIVTSSWKSHPKWLVRNYYPALKFGVYLGLLRQPTVWWLQQYALLPMDTYRMEGVAHRKGLKSEMCTSATLSCDLLLSTICRHLPEEILYYYTILTIWFISSMDFPKISMDFPPGPGQRLRGVVGLAAADVRQRAWAAAHGAELRPRRSGLREIYWVSLRFHCDK